MSNKSNIDLYLRVEILKMLKSSTDYFNSKYREIEDLNQETITIQKETIQHYSAYNTILDKIEQIFNIQESNEGPSSS